MYRICDTQKNAIKYNICNVQYYNNICYHFNRIISLTFNT